jgi:ubiquinone/menaquinone biosynthesis C-methylase UbiE
MKRLEGGSELLDGPLDARLLAGNLRDLARFNDAGGGAELSYRALEPYLNAGSRLRLLDVGTGAADIPRSLVRWAGTNRKLHVVATDVRPEIVSLAQANATDTLEVKQAPADRIDEADRSFDIVHSSLLLHHLDPHDAARMLAEMARVARRAVIVNDLDRRRRWLWAARVLTVLATRNAYTRNDAPLSVRRAYRPNEVTALAATVGLREVKRLWANPAYRYALVFEHA